MYYTQWVKMVEQYKFVVFLFYLIALQKLNLCNGAEAFTVCNSQGYSLYGKPIPQLLGECSGRGQCIENNTACLCEKGWTGRSAFINSEGIDCQVNIYVLKTFWGIVLVYSIFIQIKYVIPNFRYRWKAYVTMYRTRNVSIRKIPLFLAYFSYELLNFPCILALSLISIIYDDERIGVTFWSTMLFCIAGMGYSISHYLFQTALLEMFLTHRYFAQSGTALVLINFIKCSSLFLDFVLGSKYLIPIVMYATDSGDITYRTRVLWCTYVLLQGISLYSTGLQAWYIKRNISIELEKIYSISKNSNFRILAAKLEKLQTNGVIQASMFGSIYMVILFFPFLWNRHDYFLPIVCFGAASIGALMTKSHVEGPISSDDASTLSSRKDQKSSKGVEVSSENLEDMDEPKTNRPKPKPSFEISEGYTSFNDFTGTPKPSMPPQSLEI